MGIAQGKNNQKGIISRFRELTVEGKIWWIFVLLCYLAAAVMFVHNLGYKGLWYDESGQFFISRGLNHWSEPYSAPGGLSAVLYSNSHYNHDPGGFGILLWLFEKVSTDVSWLRVLPLIFFIGAMVFSAKAVYAVTRNAGYAALGALLPMLIPEYYGADELRAYSMELCGVAYGIWMVFRLKQGASVKRILLLSLLLTFFITARYAMVMYTFFFSCIILVNLWLSRESVKSFWIRALVYSAPLLVMVGLIWHFSMSIQNPHAAAYGYFEYLPRPFTFGYMICICISIVSVVSWKWQTSRMRLMTILFFVTTIGFLLLGMMDKLPFLLNGLKGGSPLFICLVQLTTLGYVLLQRMKVGRWTKWVMLGVLMLIPIGKILSYPYPMRTFGFMPAERRRADFTSQITHACEISPERVILVIDDFCPTVRYEYEFGGLRDKVVEHGYPNHFLFWKGSSHNYDSPGFPGQKWDSIDRDKFIEYLGQMPVGDIFIYDSSFFSFSNDVFKPVEPGIIIKVKEGGI